MAKADVVAVYPHFRQIDSYIVHLEEYEQDATVEIDVVVDAQTYEVRGAEVVRRVETRRHLDADETRALVDVDAVVRAARNWR